MESEYVFPRQEQTAFEQLKQPFAVFQFLGTRIAVRLLSDGFMALFGYSDRTRAYSDINRDLFQDLHPEDKDRVSAGILRFAAEGGSYDAVYRSRIPDSSRYRVIHAYFNEVFTDTGACLAYAWYADEGIDEGSDEEKHSAEHSDLFRALSRTLQKHNTARNDRYDYLTGLPGVDYFFKLVGEEKKRIKDTGGTPVFLYIDFLGMKFFNSKHGFSRGDQLLQRFGEMLNEVYGKNRSCRIESDHFAVITEEASLESSLHQMIHRYQAMEDVQNLPLHVGVYKEEEEAADTRTSFERAKLACRALDARYETAVNHYSQTLSRQAEIRLYFMENLDRAIAERWIKVYFQPIIRAVSGQICDIEALARWVDPVRGVISPAEFIPALEEAGLIYKLDLYVVDRVLELIHIQKERGLFIIPHSINLSRSDFDACDVVEEIRRRVDAAGVARDRITIEITESIMGSDFDFMKQQVERFRALGFPVWMDDFGSGYSSLDVLQSIPFDLIKFDMSFMRRLDEGINGKILLTELMRMAGALGLDTVCEGVETAEQIQFLQEIGCSKLQGYYFGKPIPFQAIHEMEENHTLLETEKPEESVYYETVSRTNLYDIGTAAGEETDAFHNVFESLPASILEITENRGRFIRYNRSYQDFVKRFFGDEVRHEFFDLHNFDIMHAASFFTYTGQNADTSHRFFFHDRMPDGSVIHSFMRRIARNPLTGSIAISIIILSVSEPDENTTYADIAQALAADFYNIYVINLDTDEYVEYASRAGGEELLVQRRGNDFFAAARSDSLTRVYEKDRDMFLSLFTKENILHDLDQQGVFTLTYRLTDTGTPMYVNMKITRMRGGNRIILGINNIDANMKQQEEGKKLRREKRSLGRIAALSPDYIVLYTIDPETGSYTQYNPSNEFSQFALSSTGEDFFGDVIRDAYIAIAPEDIEHHLQVMTKENMLGEMEKNRFLIHRYRLLLNQDRVPVTLKAALVEEDGKQKIILGVTKD